MELTKSELEVMNVLWDAGEALGRTELVDRPHKWKTSSCYIIINGLLRKGAIREAGVVKRCKTYARVFEPVISKEEYWAQLAFNGKEKPDAALLVTEILMRAACCPEEGVAILSAAQTSYFGRCDIV